MIKFRIHPKIWERDRCNFGKTLEKCENYRFLKIVLDILHKMKENLNQERVKRGLLSSQGKTEKIAPDFSDSFPV